MILESPHFATAHAQGPRTHLGRAALPRRPDFSRDERSDVPIHEHTDTAFRLALDARDGEVGCAAAHPYRENGGGRFLERLHDYGIMHWDHEPKHIGRAALPRRPKLQPERARRCSAPPCVTTAVSSRAERA